MKFRHPVVKSLGDGEQPPGQDCCLSRESCLGQSGNGDGRVVRPDRTTVVGQWPISGRIGGKGPEPITRVQARRDQQLGNP